MIYYTTIKIILGLDILKSSRMKISYKFFANLTYSKKDYRIICIILSRVTKFSNIRIKNSILFNKLCITIKN